MTFFTITHVQNIPFILFFFILLCAPIQGTETSDNSSLVKGKRFFYSGAFKKAEKSFRKALKKEPENPEALYFLGYTLSRILGKYHEEIPQTSFENCEIISKPLEQVLKLQPIYKGEQYLLNPQDKIMSEWSCLALRYMYEDKEDKIKIAFEQAKNRGGFNDAISEFMYNMLVSCPPNAILVTAGDMDTFHGLYLQIMQHIRADVTIVNVHLLRSPWYIRMVMKEHFWQTKTVRFNMIDKDLHTMSNFQQKYQKPFELSIPKYCSKSDTEHTISLFVTPIIERNTDAKPPINELVLCKMAEANPTRPLCFAITLSNFQIAYRFEINDKKISLDSLLEFNGLFNRLTFCKNSSDVAIAKFKQLIYNEFRFEAIPNSPAINDVKMFNYYFSSVSQIAKYLEENEREESAREILAWFAKKVPGIRYLENNYIRNYLLNFSGKAHE